MKQKLIGRKEEKKILERALNSPEAEMVAVIGRRRVGKTFLVQNVYKKRIVFEITGLQNNPLANQLRVFQDQLTEFSKSSLPIQQPKDWLEAFQLLKTYLKSQMGEEKKVVFFDELPWLATHKSGFLSAFGYFWNTWAVRQNIVVVICGSAASWMIKKVVNSTGGLHNRITKRIYLYPFTLAETEAYLKSRHHDFTRYQILQLYMAMGGIPHYLKEIEIGKSAIQNIDYLCFSKNGMLNDEFLRLYPSLFTKASNHFAIVRTLATKKQGLTRQQIAKISQLSNGGGLTKVIEELLHSGFISVYQAFGKKKREKRYRLSDEYSLFYLQFIENNTSEGKEIWQHLSQTQAFKAWSGYAFEGICLKHLPQIKKALSIAGIYSTTSSFYKKGNATEEGLQIDLLIDRNDQVINLFEIKFYTEVFSLSKAYDKRLRQKRQIFRELSQTNKQLSWVFITTYGLKPNSYSLDLAANSLTMNDLFEEA